MEIRIRLTDIDEYLKSRIEQAAGDGSKNEAARFLMRYWAELERCRDLPQIQSDTGQMSPSDGKSDEINLNALDEIDLDF